MATKAFARYTTFKEGELERTLHTLDPQGRYRHLTGAGTGRSRSGIITSHTCTVTYPDATTGTCRYLRGGPNWHIFRFEHTSQRCGKTASLPVQNETERIGNTLAVIEENAQKLAEAAFYAAVEREQRDYFRRALPPPLYKIAQGGRPQMKAKEAKPTAGRYALCIRVGRSLLPTGDAWDKMADAVEAWKIGNDLSRVIGCCCRFKRRWEEPFYNPLHGDSRYPCPPLPFPCADQKPAQETAKLDGQAIQAAALATPSVGSKVIVAATAPQWAVVGESIPAHSEEDAPPGDDCDDYDEFDESPDLWEGDEDE